MSRWDQDIDGQQGSLRANGGAKTNGPMKAVRRGGGAGFGKQKIEAEGTGAQSRQYDRPAYESRNRRNGDWWYESWQGLYAEGDSLLGIVANPVSFHGAHFATFPPKLIQPCLVASCAAGGVVLDPFFGAGTTGVVAKQQDVRCIGIELNEEYCKIAAKRLSQGSLDFAGGGA